MPLKLNYAKENKPARAYNKLHYNFRYDYRKIDRN